MPVSHQTFHQPPVLEWVNESATVEFGTVGAFYYATPTSQRPIGLNIENGTTLSNQTESTDRNGSYIPQSPT